MRDSRGITADDTNPPGRFARRVEYYFPVTFQIENEIGTFAGELRNISQSGALLGTDRPLSIGSRVVLSSAPKAVIALEQIEGEVVRLVGDIGSHGTDYAVEFRHTSVENVTALGYVVKSASRAEQGRTIPVLKISVLGGLFIGLPTILILGNLLHPGIKNITLGAVLILLAVERTLETFMTLHRKGAMKAAEDWTISAVSFYYVCMMLFASTESLFVRGQLWIPAVVVGAVLILSAMALRWWGMKALGQLWEIQLVGARQWTLQSKNITLIKSGPYQHMRHPVYAGLILELIGIPLMANAFWTLGFVLLVNVPLQILRIRLEEKQLLQIVGGDYASYMDECLALIPWHRKIEKINQDRRTRDLVIDFADRRIR